MPAGQIPQNRGPAFGPQVEFRRQMKQVMESAGYLQLGHESRLHLTGVPAEVRGPTIDIVREMAGGRPAAPQSRIDPLVRHGVHKSCRVPNEQHISVHQRRVRLPDRKVVASRAPEICGIESVVSDQSRKAIAEHGSDVLPPADPDVQVISLGKYPSVSAGHLPDIQSKRGPPSVGKTAR